MKKQMAAYLLLAFLIYPAEARSDNFTIIIREDLLNRLAMNAGKQSFDGVYNHRTPEVLGQSIIIPIHWRVKIQDVKYSITSQGISFTADMDAHFTAANDFLNASYAENISGTASAQIVANELRLRISTISIPLVVDIPLVGRVTIYTITTTVPSYHVTHRFDPRFFLRIGDVSRVSGQVSNLTRTYAQDQIVITGSARFW